MGFSTAFKIEMDKRQTTSSEPCSSEGATVQCLVLSLFKLNFEFQNKIFKKISNLNRGFKIDQHFQIFKSLNTMPTIINLSDIWEHTLSEILNHGPKTELGIIL